MIAAPALAPTGYRQLTYRHLIGLTDGRGIFEHALHAEPRRAHGYCLDDVSRALVVVVRDPAPSAMIEQLADTYLRFVERAITADGLAHNRMEVSGTWTDEPGLGDWWGRAVSALGTVVADAEHPAMRIRASQVFQRALAQRPAEVRTMAFAVIGAAEVLRSRPESAAAHSLIADALTVLPSAAVGGWNWPEPRLRYANATLAEALLAVGGISGDDALIARALGFLGSLLELETAPEGNLSVTGQAGRAAGECGPFFDQQPIEVAAMADACARAFRMTHDPRWRTGVLLSWRWFDGHNDVGVPMVDPATGAGYDGLEPGGRNDNRGAESTIAALSTFQRARELGIVPARG